MRNNTVDDPDQRYDDMSVAWLKRVTRQAPAFATVECTIMSDLNETVED